jgi:predicted regulator of Ras-like GTPase activity (Roadblock/LC7/MglB family)
VSTKTVSNSLTESCVIDQILGDLVSSVKGAQAAIFLDGDGEAISQAGDMAVDLRLIGAWKEIQLDRIKEISRRVGLGEIHAVLYSLDEGNELVAPVSREYCLLLFLSAYADITEAMGGIKRTIERLKKDIE